MSVQLITRTKRYLAIEQALYVIEHEDTNVTEDDLQTMRESDLYDFLAAWGWEWDGSEWVW